MYKIDISKKLIKSINETSLDKLNLQERADLQQWIRKNSEILSRHFDYDLKIISEEFDEFEVNDRLDLMAIDETGALVVIELKRKDSGSRIDIQGLKYASYCSTLTPKRIVEIYERYLKKHKIELDALEDIISFIGSENSDPDDLNKLNHTQKIVLVSQNFDTRVKSVVAYLSKNQLDISCIEFNIFQDSNNDSLFIDTQKILPPEDIDDYFIKDISRDDSVGKKPSKLAPQPQDVLEFLEKIKNEMQEKYGKYARGMPHVKYRTFKAGRTGLLFAFEIMKKDKRYKINLISKNPNFKMVGHFEKMKNKIKNIEDYNYEIITREEGKSDWERVMIFIKPTDYLLDIEESSRLLNLFMEAMEPICEKIRTT